jgi:hypothetical protein
LVTTTEALKRLVSFGKAGAVRNPASSTREMIILTAAILETFNTFPPPHGWVLLVIAPFLGAP